MCTIESILHFSTSTKLSQQFFGILVAQGSRSIEAALFPTGDSCHLKKEIQGQAVFWLIEGICCITAFGVPQRNNWCLHCSIKGVK